MTLSSSSAAFLFEKTSFTSNVKLRSWIFFTPDLLEARGRRFSRQFKYAGPWLTLYGNCVLQRIGAGFFCFLSAHVLSKFCLKVFHFFIGEFPSHRIFKALKDFKLLKASKFLEHVMFYWSVFDALTSLLFHCFGNSHFFDRMKNHHSKCVKSVKFLLFFKVFPFWLLLKFGYCKKIEGNYDYSFKASDRCEIKFAMNNYGILHFRDGWLIFDAALSHSF